jgi:hypothetical protein
VGTPALIQQYRRPSRRHSPRRVEARRTEASPHRTVAEDGLRVLGRPGRRLFGRQALGYVAKLWTRRGSTAPTGGMPLALPRNTPCRSTRRFARLLVPLLNAIRISPILRWRGTSVRRPRNGLCSRSALGPSTAKPARTPGFIERRPARAAAASSGSLTPAASTTGSLPSSTPGSLVDKSRCRASGRSPRGHARRPPREGVCMGSDTMPVKALDRSGVSRQLRQSSRGWLLARRRAPGSSTSRAATSTASGPATSHSTPRSPPTTWTRQECLPCWSSWPDPRTARSSRGCRPGRSSAVSSARPRLSSDD